MSDGSGSACGKLPISLSSCPTCHQGFHQTRGWTWIDSDRLIETEHCASGGNECKTCPLAAPMGKVGLLWVGKAFYETPEKFSVEAGAMGISRRISAIPRDFKVGETWVWLAHPEVVKNPEPPPTMPTGLERSTMDDEELAAAEQEVKDYRPMLPGVFRVFRPTRIEYVCHGNEPDEEIEKLLARGITPVIVKRKGETDPLFGDH